MMMTMRWRKKKTEWHSIWIQTHLFN